MRGENEFFSDFTIQELARKQGVTPLERIDRLAGVLCEGDVDSVLASMEPVRAELEK